MDEVTTIIHHDSTEDKEEILYHETLKRNIAAKYLREKSLI